MNEIIISDDKTKFPVDKAIKLLHSSYWAADRQTDVIKNPSKIHSSSGRMTRRV